MGVPLKPSRVRGQQRIRVTLDYYITVAESFDTTRLYRTEDGALRLAVSGLESVIDETNADDAIDMHPGAKLSLVFLDVPRVNGIGR